MIILILVETHHIKDQVRLVEVGVDSEVGHDGRRDPLAAALELDRRTRHGLQLEGGHVADAPAQHLWAAAGAQQEGEGGNKGDGGGGGSGVEVKEEVGEEMRRVWSGRKEDGREGGSGSKGEDGDGESGKRESEKCITFRGI